MVVCDGVGCWFCDLLKESYEMYDQFDSQNNVEAKLATEDLYPTVTSVVEMLQDELATRRYGKLLTELFTIPQVKKIARIKEVRAFTGLNLREAKSVLDQLNDEIPSFRSVEDEKNQDPWSKPLVNAYERQTAEAYENRIADLQRQINILIDEKCTAQQRARGLEADARGMDETIDRLRADIDKSFDRERELEVRIENSLEVLRATQRISSGATESLIEGIVQILTTEDDD